MGNILGDLIHAPRGRLTLETGVAVSTSDQSAVATIYFTPYKGNTVPIYDTAASVWTIMEFAEISLSLVGFTADKNNDVFVYNNAGTLAMERVEWTNDTTRATAITLQDGRYVKSGDASRLYVGTFRTNSTGAQSEDTVTERFVWNYYNRVLKRLYKADATNHAYSTATVRSWNNDATQRVELVIGVAEDVSSISITGESVHSSAGNSTLVGVGYDSTSTNINASATMGNYNTSYVRAGSNMKHQIGLGYHFYQITEFSAAATGTFNQAALNVGILG